MIKVSKEVVEQWVAERLTIERGYSAPPLVKMLGDGSIVVITLKEKRPPLGRSQKKDF